MTFLVFDFCVSTIEVISKRLMQFDNKSRSHVAYVSFLSSSVLVKFLCFIMCRVLTRISCNKTV